MSTSYFWLATAFLCALLLGCSATDNSSRPILSELEIYTFGHQYTRWFYTHELDSLVSRIVNPDYTVQQLRSFRVEVQRSIGEEEERLNERTSILPFENNYYQFVRFSRFEKTDRVVQTSFGFDDSGNIFEFTVENMPEEAPTRFWDYKTKTKLRLPFDGEWTVASGGRTINLNNHTVAEDQRFAYDFLIKHDGRTFQTTGRRNEDYYCYEREILAPGSGIVVDIRNDIPENKLGDMPANSGNRVIIDHGNGEFSVLAHFKKGTVVVDVGHQVEMGQLLGLCGNSGHSSEPHLHYHLQNSPQMFAGEGLPAQFQSYQADGESVEVGEPISGQKVRHEYK